MRIGVIGAADSWYVDQLCRAGRERGHDLRPILFDSIRSEIRSGRTQLVCGEISLQSLDVLLVRTMPPGSLEQVVVRMDQLQAAADAGVRVLNPPRAIECAVDKFLTTQRLAQAGLPVPDTIVCEHSDQALVAFEQLGQDVVVKPLFGAEGRGMLRITDAQTAWRIFRSLERIEAVLYLQRFIPAAAGPDQPAEDVRVLLLDGEVIGCMKRQSVIGDFRTNAAQAGTCTARVATADEVQLARQAARVTGCVFCGVDLMYDQSGQPLVIEVNAVPGWKALQRACGVSVSGILFDWLERTSAADVDVALPAPVPLSISS